ncbi:iron ABC transporter permease [Gluconobacter sp. Dm-62]|uniref:FecCD family ABC transporter permease n=1 Tax=Gluconobacter sp. Dm-62 TaxID=2799804 RepID=UPI001B8C44B9|nr:iron ABC transporter permease [Gluconobacter sp. Dm-62]MBS1101636.1 iron ABC transporter permease [Gluconobacter sp. Dm-62]
MIIARPSSIIVLLGLMVLLIIATAGALMVGATGLGFRNLLHVGINGKHDASWLIVTQIRGPRAFLAILAGAALAASGTVMQGLFRNPLADPGLIGVSSGAALGAAIMIVLGGAGSVPDFLSDWMVLISGMIGSLVCTTLLYVFATRNGLTSTTLIMLAGVALGAFSGAITGILIFRANDTALRDLTFWTMGSLSGAAWSHNLVLLPFLLVAAILMTLIAKPLNALLLGEDNASLMGYPVQRIKCLAMFGVAFATGPVVACVGVIGFIGVVVPHLVRLVTGPDHRILLPASALLGASLLLVSDTLARVIALPADVPVGVVTAAIGAPAFIWLLTRSHQADIPS